MSHWTHSGAWMSRRERVGARKSSEVETNGEGKQEKILLFSNSGMWAQDKGPKSPHCPTELSGIQEIGFIALDSCEKSWLCQLNFAVTLQTLMNRKWDCVQSFFKVMSYLPVGREPSAIRAMLLSAPILPSPPTLLSLYTALPPTTHPFNQLAGRSLLSAHHVPGLYWIQKWVMLGVWLSDLQGTQQ